MSRHILKVEEQNKDFNTPVLANDLAQLSYGSPATEFGPWLTGLCRTSTVEMEYFVAFRVLTHNGDQRKKVIHPYGVLILVDWRCQDSHS